MSEEFYNGFAEYYHFHLAAVGRDDVRFFTELCRSTGGKVLEVGCGTGRTLIPCAKAGADVTGLDLSGDMLSFCRKAVNQESRNVNSRVELVKADNIMVSASDRPMTDINKKQPNNKLKKLFIQ